jgi:hypothetical protein
MSVALAAWPEACLYVFPKLMFLNIPPREGLRRKLCSILMGSHGGNLQRSCEAPRMRSSIAVMLLVSAVYMAKTTPYLSHHAGQVGKYTNRARCRRAQICRQLRSRSQKSA